jgi:hypothetical protein
MKHFRCCINYEYILILLFILKNIFVIFLFIFLFVFLYGGLMLAHIQGRNY